MTPRQAVINQIDLELERLVEGGYISSQDRYDVLEELTSCSMQELRTLADAYDTGDLDRLFRGKGE